MGSDCYKWRVYQNQCWKHAELSRTKVSLKPNKENQQLEPFYILFKHSKHSQLNLQHYKLKADHANELGSASLVRFSLFGSFKASLLIITEFGILPFNSDLFQL